jgi:hypothetical protein
MRTTAALAATLVFVAACGTRPGPSVPAKEAPAPAGGARVTVHVKDMTKVLNIA